MELERLELELRPRGHWQAVDLGFALLRRHACTVLPAWLILWSAAMLPALILTLVFPGLEGAAAMLPWLLRPLLERLPLHMLSRGVFGEVLEVRGGLRAWPSLCRDRWVSSLTWGRLVPARGLVRCAHQLEGGGGPGLSARTGLLRRDGTGLVSGLWLLCCAHFELLLTFLPMLGLGIFLPGRDIANPFAFLVNGNGMELGHQLVLLAGYWLAGAAIGPVFVAGSFTLYLERRSSLDAWDLEIALRRMVRRHVPSARLLLVLVLGLVATATSGTCEAPAWDVPPKREAARDTAQARIRRRVDSLLADSAFRTWRCSEIWVPRDTLPEKKGAFPPWLEAFFNGVGKGMRGIGRALAWSAEGIRLGLILLALGAVGALLWRFRGILPKGWGKGASPEPLTGHVHALAAQDDPGRLRERSEAALSAGDFREALGLLYRACLLAFPVAFPRGGCERQCQRLAHQALEGQVVSKDCCDLLDDLVRQREAVLWAGRDPDPSEIRDLARRLALLQGSGGDACATA